MIRNGKTLLSGIDPVGRAVKIADTISAADRTLYFCPSPLYGYGLERLLERLSQFPSSAVLCVEADAELFSLSQKHIDPAIKNNPQFRLTGCCDAGGLCSFLRGEWGARFFGRLETVRFNGGWQLFANLYNNLAETLRQEIALDWGNALTLTKLGRRFIRNAVRNLASLSRRHSLERLSFGNDPVLVLGAGPSLDNFLDNFVSHFGSRLADDLQMPEKRPFKIICVDTCLPALKARKITPDMAVVLESQHLNLDDFAGLSGWKVNAAMDLSALPRSGEVLSGDLSLFFTPWTDLAVFERLRASGLLPLKIPPLGSVGLTAVAIALKISGGKIVTAGLDFSFAADAYHARSTPGHLSKLRRHNRFTSLFNAEAAYGETAIKAVSKSGDQILSSPILIHYRNLFERVFSAEKLAASRLFDITGSGLPLGLKTVSAAEAVNILCENSSIRQNETEAAVCPAPKKRATEKLQAFARKERKRLTLLRNMLSGVIPPDHETIDTLINECDYLWAHFPDYAASSRRPVMAELEKSGSAISFLKRLRAEIDPFLELWALYDLESDSKSYKCVLNAAT